MLLLFEGRISLLLSHSKGILHVKTVCVYVNDEEMLTGRSLCTFPNYMSLHTPDIQQKSQLTLILRPGAL